MYGQPGEGEGEGRSTASQPCLVHTAFFHSLTHTHTHSRLFDALSSLPPSLFSTATLLLFLAELSSPPCSHRMHAHLINTAVASSCTSCRSTPLFFEPSRQRWGHCPDCILPKGLWMVRRTRQNTLTPSLLPKRQRDVCLLNDATPCHVSADALLFLLCAPIRHWICTCMPVNQCPVFLVHFTQNPREQSARPRQSRRLGCTTRFQTKPYPPQQMRCCTTTALSTSQRNNKQGGSGQIFLSLIETMT
ncbi:hypothetical protein B0O80DRAFT_279656 [Mortierella sp. GBAus27b]|nr:hypothetical protein B0O80DRAFT_279656 [Mortierella sp. GBAus27b]